jgi:hypothetical protein
MTAEGEWSFPSTISDTHTNPPIAVATTPLSNKSSIISSAPDSFADHWRQHPLLLSKPVLGASRLSYSSLWRLQSRQRFCTLLAWSIALHCILFHLSVDTMHQRASIDGVIVLGFRFLTGFFLLRMICIFRRGLRDSIAFFFLLSTSHCIAAASFMDKSI